MKWIKLDEIKNLKIADYLIDVLIAMYNKI